jgi:hypothetical protein
MMEIVMIVLKELLLMNCLVLVERHLCIHLFLAIPLRRNAIMLARNESLVVIVVILLITVILNLTHVLLAQYLLKDNGIDD